MITRLQKARSSVSGILDYNEDKVAHGVATPVMLKNTPYDNDPPEQSPIAAIYGLFDDLENLPNLSTKVRTPSFHMTVNPSEADGQNISEEKVLSYISDVMNGLGYGEQPYIVYRHNDIDREHWHVVSTKIRPNGTMIHNPFDATLLMKLQRELCFKYGFVPGKDESSEQAEQYDPVLEMNGRGFPTFDTKAWNKKKLFRAIFETALAFAFRSFKTFQRIMESMGVKVNVVTKNGKKHLAMYGLKGGKKNTSRSFQDEDLYNTAYQMVEDRIASIRAIPFEETESVTKIKLASDYILEQSSSLDEYVSKMDSVGLIVTAKRVPVDGISDMTIISRRMRTVLDSEDNTLDVAPMNEAEKNGHWMAPHRGRKPKVAEESKTLSDKQLAELKKRLRALSTETKREKAKKGQQQSHSTQIKR